MDSFFCLYLTRIWENISENLTFHSTKHKRYLELAQQFLLTLFVKEWLYIIYKYVFSIVYLEILNIKTHVYLTLARFMTSLPFLQFQPEATLNTLTTVR